ncbi:ribosomal protein L1 superfamily protein [Rhodotorula toruloides]|uniref:Ribosomal protein L1 superfamily protein n=1 Tax=Rhodotorula toruloides TaxID=5286 RepID=A0A511KKT1_RHOTO|nr:ribosomal protein L1 superfamily protein [Rhodotorula toruloides]
MATIATVTSTSSTSQAPPPLWKPASVAPRQLPPLPARPDIPVSSAQCEKALNALLKHVENVQEKRGEEELLGEQEEKVFLVVGLKQAPKRETHKPVRIPVPHPVLNPRQSPVTLFVKDPQREYKDLIASSNIGFISRVVGLDKLRKKHKTYEAKRQLLKEADLFLVDDRVMVDVGKCLGKMWRDAKKQPIPVAIQRKDLKAELERAIASTYMNVTTGTALSIKLGTTDLHSASDLLANLDAVLPYIASRIPQVPSSFSNIQSLHLKTSTSTSLPIYNAPLSERFEGTGLTAEQEKERAEKLEKKKAEKEERRKRDEEREARKKEQSATKDGQGRFEKKRERDEEEEGEDGEQVETVREKASEAKEPKAKKAKKTSAAPVASKKALGKKAKA